jgi:hypothetical protein
VLSSVPYGEEGSRCLVWRCGKGGYQPWSREPAASCGDRVGLEWRVGTSSVRTDPIDLPSWRRYRGTALADAPRPRGPTCLSVQALVFRRASVGTSLAVNSRRRRLTVVYISAGAIALILLIVLLIVLL